ncbi:unnamed protein product, partial [Meganyctiphanes norvegica]
TLGAPKLDDLVENAYFKDNMDENASFKDNMDENVSFKDNMDTPNLDGFVENIFFKDTLDATNIESFFGNAIFKDTMDVSNSGILLENVTSPKTRILMYNRIPKTGSTTLIKILHQLADLNNFHHLHSRDYTNQNMSDADQQELPKKLVRIPTKSPFSFDRHFFFFEIQGIEESQNFAWMNFVRDPVERLISRFYYQRIPQRWEKEKYLRDKVRPPVEWFLMQLDDCVPDCLQDLFEGLGVQQITYFCGHHPNCSVMNSHWALQQAKQNVESYYSVVGVLEELPLSLQVLQHYLPRFFKDVTTLQSSQGSTHKNENHSKKQASESTKSLLKEHIPLDFEFYQYLRQRLYLQAQALGIN